MTSLLCDVTVLFTRLPSCDITVRLTVITATYVRWLTQKKEKLAGLLSEVMVHNPIEKKASFSFQSNKCI